DWAADTNFADYFVGRTAQTAQPADRGRPGGKSTPVSAGGRADREASGVPATMHCRRDNPQQECNSMSRQLLLVGAAMAWAATLLTGLSGCRPQQPFYLFDDGDLSHYLDVATEIDYPDVDECPLADVEGAIRPFSLSNSDSRDIWNLNLDEAVRTAMENSKVIRSIGGRIQPMTPLGTVAMPDYLVRSPEAASTVYDPALVESNPRFGTEAALSAFDTQFTSSVFWEKNDAPRNPLVFPGSEAVFPRVAKDDVGSFQVQLAKTAATGGQWILRHHVDYSKQNTSRLFISDWNVNLEAEFRQPLLQRAGVQFNRIAGPGAIPGFNNGVMIARINTDIRLAEFEASIRNLVSDVENAYWDLYFAYRRLDAVVAGRDSGLQTWRQMHAQLIVGTGDAAEEAQARNQYFLFESAMERSLNALYEAESRLRYIMGLAATDGRLIRPADEPTTAKVEFDWHECHGEALTRSVELREQRWKIKQRDLELISAKNYLLPQLDAVGRYRWLGLGDDLLGNTDGPDGAFNNAYQSMTTGDFAEWHLGLELNIPIGFRKEMAGVRYAQLNLARERSLLQEQELEVSHQLAWAIREMDAYLKISQTNFNRRIAARAEVKTAEAKMEAGVSGGTLDRVLDAQRRLAEAESDYYESLVNYNKAITNVHYRKGSLLEYNGVHLAEGPWPGKAYFDARRQARQRDASFYLDYGFTRPKVISRGTYEQEAGGGVVLPDGGIGIDGPIETQDLGPEQIPAPAAEPIAPPGQSVDPSAAEPPDPRPNMQAGGPAIGETQTAPWITIKRTLPANDATARDLGLLDLSALAAKPAAEHSGGTARPSPVEKATYQEPATRSQSGQTARAETDSTAKKSRQDTWVNSKRADTKHESVANPPATETVGSASGWKRLQR
ncbi:MAG: hypothetical protein A2V70_11705, partial [Planctomycetes bacterium RBG_13_63_9]